MRSVGHPESGAAVNPLLNAVHHPKFVPVIVALILAVGVIWLCAALYGWRRIMWRELMDTRVTLLPRQVRGNGSEVADTGTLLTRVNDIPGAIGYAQISDAATHPDVETIKLNGWDPTIGAVQQGAYPF